jgi:hypothetical protein
MDHTHLARAPYAAGPAGSVGVSVGVASERRRSRTTVPSAPLRSTLPSSLHGDRQGSKPKLRREAGWHWQVGAHCSACFYLLELHCLLHCAMARVIGSRLSSLASCPASVPRCSSLENLRLPAPAGAHLGGTDRSYVFPPFFSESMLILRCGSVFGLLCR